MAVCVPLPPRWKRVGRWVTKGAWLTFGRLECGSSSTRRALRTRQQRGHQRAVAAAGDGHRPPGDGRLGCGRGPRERRRHRGRAHGGTGARLRVYADSDSIWFTLNASWNGSAWARDNNERTVLIADDDRAHRRMAGAVLEAVGLTCRFAADGEEAVREIDRAVPTLLLLDLRMPRLDGLGVLRRIAARLPELPVVVITAHGDVPSAVEAMKLGARDFLEKPVDIEELRAVAADILDRPGPVVATEPDDEPRSLVGASAAMRQVRDAVRRAAGANSTVLIRGESGTGKELVARATHELSARSRGPLVALNCAAVPEGLLESELFGHERGAFTGADSPRRGRFEQAHGGTIFLDEIAELHPHLQAKLLRVLQERVVERVGGGAAVPVDLRVIAATNRDLTADISTGRFRADLYYRLAVLEIFLPPLRERREDVLPIAQHLLRRLRPTPPARMSAAVATTLTQHEWPGNVRELSNVLERALLFAGDGDIEISHLPPPLSTLVAVHANGMTDTVAGGTGVLAGMPLQDVERELIAKTLASLGGNRTRTAEALGMSRRALIYKIKRFAIDG